jgi:hypothetical protein
MYLDIVYIYVHSKCNVSRKAKTSYNLERREYIVFTRYLGSVGRTPFRLRLFGGALPNGLLGGAVWIPFQ